MSSICDDSGCNQSYWQLTANSTESIGNAGNASGGIEKIGENRQFNYDAGNHAGIRVTLL